MTGWEFSGLESGGAGKVGRSGYGASKRREVGGEKVAEEGGGGGGCGWKGGIDTVGSRRDVWGEWTCGGVGRGMGWWRRRTGKGWRLGGRRGGGMDGGVADRPAVGG